MILTFLQAGDRVVRLDRHANVPNTPLAMPPSAEAWANLARMGLTTCNSGKPGGELCRVGLVKAEAGSGGARWM